MAVRATVDEVQRVISAAVDGAFYRAAYPELDGPTFDPIRHYAATGWREGRDPAPWFSVEAYLATNADVRRSGTEPLYHYLLIGRREGRSVRPSAQGQAYLTALTDRGEIPAWRFAPLAPSLAAAPSAAPEPEAEPVPPTEVAAPPEPPADKAYPGERDLVAREFDAAYYLATHPDIAEAGVDPLQHFLEAGWRERRDPNPRFSVAHYLETYPDIALAGVNPFAHYLIAGRSEGRTPRGDLGFRYAVLAETQPVEARIAAIRKLKPAATDRAPVLAAALAQSRTGLKDLHVTFSHDDYSANLGGVQLCLQREDARIVELGRDHLHLYPLKPWPVVRDRTEPGDLGVLWNGVRVGAFPAATIAATLKAAAAGVTAGERSFAIHSLLGHSADEVLKILGAVDLKDGYFWLHDFASLCAGFHLLRNDVEDCAAPPPESPACGICAYLPLRKRHLDQHARLFQRLSLTVVSPSEPTLALWRERASFPRAGEVVLPHATLVARQPATLPRRPRPLRIAYAGVPAAHKGWPIFRELAVAHAEDDRYEFLHLGGRPTPGLPIAFHEVAVSEARPRLMQETLERLQVDVALIWPLCRETFSFIAYEAAAAGCAVVTGPDSGNVQAFVRDSGHGCVLPDETALSRALESGEIGKLARAKRKPMLYDLDFSALTVDLLRPRTGK